MVDKTTKTIHELKELYREIKWDYATTSDLDFVYAKINDLEKRLDNNNIY